MLFNHATPRAEVAELVDALGSGSSGGISVEVRVLSSAPNEIKGLRKFRSPFVCFCTRCSILPGTTGIGRLPPQPSPGAIVLFYREILPADRRIKGAGPQSLDNVLSSASILKKRQHGYQAPSSTLLKTRFHAIKICYSI